MSATIHTLPDTDANQPGKRISIKPIPKASQKQMAPDELERMRERNRLLTTRFAPDFLVLVDELKDKGLIQGKDFRVTCMDFSISEEEYQKILLLTGDSNA